MEQKSYEYTLKQSSQFKKDLKAVKFVVHFTPVTRVPCHPNLRAFCLALS